MFLRVMRCRFAFLLAALALFSCPASAHIVPVDALVQMYMKPQGHTLKVLIRMPLKSDLDADWPRRSDGAVDLAHVNFALRTATTVSLLEQLKIYENGKLLTKPRIVNTRISLNSDRSFVTYKKALAHVTGPPLPPKTTSIYWQQSKLDALVEYPIKSDRSSFSIHAAFNRLALHEVTTLQFLEPNGVSRAFELNGDAGLVPLKPSWFYAAGRFVVMGIKHILSGIDHLLFLFCLVIPFRRIRPLIPVVTAFTVAHSITLIGSAYGYAPNELWFPPLIEMLIAMSIIYMALENIIVEHPTQRWVITFFFGLVHGFGFSFILRNTMQFAGAHVLTSLLSFNVGVEIGQLFVLALYVPALNFFFNHVVAKQQRLGTIILSALAAHQAWHWMENRYDALSQFPFPTITAAGIVSTLRWLTVLVVVAALVWAVSVVTKRWEQPAEQEVPRSPAE